MSETPETPATPAAPAAPAAPKPAAPPPPPVKTLEEILADPLVADAVVTVREHVLSAKEFAKEITLTIDRDQIVPVCLAFKNDGDFKYLVDLTGVDYSKYPNHTGVRFCVAYVLYSFSKNARVRLKVWTEEKWPVPSVSSVWKTANWHERETFDMFGIQFSGHPNLERILMWEGFNGHPLRKDFPIRGIDTGARIYPEVFPEGGGPSPGATGKTADDMNIYEGQWTQYGTNPEAAATGTARPGVAKVEEK